jgi:uncharacterized protein YhfF
VTEYEEVLRNLFRGDKMPFPLIDGYRTVEFGNPGESRNKILDFLFNGEKRATAGRLASHHVPYQAS